MNCAGSDEFRRSVDVFWCGYYGLKSWLLVAFVVDAVIVETVGVAATTAGMFLAV
jgi:hypothetical protein